MRTDEIKNVSQMSGKELVAQYNEIATELDRPSIKKFSTLAIGRKRVSEISQDWAESIENDAHSTNALNEHELALLNSELKPRRPCTLIQTADFSMNLAEAREAGYILYWNGERCEHGHASPRYSSDGKCKVCYREYKNKTRAANEVSKEK